MSKRVNIYHADFVNFLQDSIEIPLHPGAEVVIHEIAEQVVRAAILVVQAHIAVGKTQEDACVETYRMLREYMQDPKRALYSEIIFGALAGVVKEIWEVHANALKSTREFPVMSYASQN